MATVRVTGLKGIQSRLRKAITRVLRSKSLRMKLGELVTESIKKKTFRRVSSSEPYYKFRSNITNKKDGAFNNSKINITITGDLLKDIAKNVRVNTTAGKVVYEIQASDKLHKPYRLKTGRSTKRVPFSTIQEGIERYYDFLNFDDKTIRSLIKLVQKELNKELSKLVVK